MSSPLESLKQLQIAQRLRPANLSYYFWRKSVAARIALIRGYPASGTQPNCSWILGCGRSGTSILGACLEMHPDVAYMFEPSERWAVVEPATDVWQTFRRGPSRAILDASDVRPGTLRRYRALFRTPRGKDLLVEKSPANSLRIGFLERLQPGARYVHIVRDGVDVARSAAEWAERDSDMLGGRTHNLWWGVCRSKWRALLVDGLDRGYFVDEAGALRSDVQRASYEWMISLSEVDDRRAALGDRLLDIRYDELTTRPREVLTRVAGHLGLPLAAGWLDRAAAEVREGRVRSAESISLPRHMAAAFNERQAHLGFAGRAQAQG